MLIILTYHSISDENYDYSVSPDNFEKQLYYLQEKFRIISLSELLRVLKDKKMPEENLVLITFDDGVEDNYKNAFPILKKIGVPAVIFIATDFIGKTMTNADGYFFRFLDASQIKEMAESGLIKFGSHTHTHPVLTELNDENKINKELEESKNILEGIIKKPVKALAYPKGKSNEKIRKLAAKYYEAAFGGEGIVGRLSETESFDIHRITITSDVSPIKFRFMLWPFYWRLKSVKNFLKL